ncbi:MAG TPA: C25 family cysteine peptidase [Myxococcales bacterium]|nr:C25 family cysteine peptidase [Myxococcales bacterium]
MPTSSTPEWVLAAPRSALEALRPLVAAHAARGRVRLLLRDRLDPPAPAEVASALGGAAGVLVAGDRRRSPRSVLPGPFLTAPDGRSVPAGWLPLGRGGGQPRFVAAAAEVVSRRRERVPLALLGQWDEQVTRIVEKSLRIFGNGSAAKPLWWTADRMTRRDLLGALRLGLGAAVYYGHGRPYGWAGYHGLHNRHLQYARGRPAGAILSLTCRTAARSRAGISFSEALVVEGVAAAAVGAVTPTRTVDNWWWGTRLCEVLAEGAETLGDLLTRARPMRPEAVAAYRIVGDPLAPLDGAPGAAAACARVWAPAPGDPPAPPDYEALLARAAST